MNEWMNEWTITLHIGLKTNELRIVFQNTYIKTRKLSNHTCHRNNELGLKLQQTLNTHKNFQIFLLYILPFLSIIPL